MNVDKAIKTYWDTTWQHQELPPSINPNDHRLRNYVNTQLHSYFRAVLGGQERAGQRLLEVGCAKSVWLPYFAGEFGFEISGLDYSEIGCEQAQQILERERVVGEIICADFFAPPAELLGQFDVVVSFGVVEHFSDTRSCLSALSRFLMAGGIMITLIPNLRSVYGVIQKIVNRPVFDKHLPLDIDDLIGAHEPGSLHIIDSRYLLSNNFGLLNLNGLDPGRRSVRLRRLVLAALRRLSLASHWVETRISPLPNSRAFSPYIACIAEKTAEVP